MFSLSSLLFTLSLFLFSLAACSAAQPQPLVFGEPVWADGETSVYRVTNREDRIVGTATFQVGQRVEDGGWTLIALPIGAAALAAAAVKWMQEKK